MASGQASDPMLRQTGPAAEPHGPFMVTKEQWTELQSSLQWQRDHYNELHAEHERMKLAQLELGSSGPGTF